MDLIHNDFDNNLNVLATPNVTFPFPIKYQDGLFRTLDIGALADTFVVKTSHDCINWETVSSECNQQSNYLFDFPYANGLYVITARNRIFVVNNTACNMVYYANCFIGLFNQYTQDYIL